MGAVDRVDVPAGRRVGPPPRRTPRPPARGPASGRGCATGSRARSPGRRRSRTSGPACARDRGPAGSARGRSRRPRRRPSSAKSSHSRSCASGTRARDADQAGPNPSVDVVAHGADDALLRTGSARRTGRTAAPGRPRSRPTSPNTSTSPRAPIGDVGRQVGVGDAPPDAEAVAAGRHPADDRAVDAHGLVAEADRARVVEHEAAQPLARARPRCAATSASRPRKSPLSRADREAQAGLVRRLLGRDVGGPGAVALLEPQGIDRPVAAGDQPVRRARRPQRVPQRGAVLRRGRTAPSRARRRT